MIGNRHLRALLTTLILVVAAIVALWAFEGRQRDTGGRIRSYPSLSYAPFVDGRSPGDLPTTDRIDRDMTVLSRVTTNIRIYAACAFGDTVLKAARKRNMTVWLGIWVDRDPAATRRELRCGIDLARRYPVTVKRLVIGNEALYRRDITEPELIALIDEAKARVPQPVAYADVAPVWREYRRVAAHVDEVIVHLLPYWDDEFGTGTPQLVAGNSFFVLDSVRALYPGKPIIVGEIGWPTDGTPKLGRIPSRQYQTEFLRSFINIARKQSLDINIIEAFDQPWKADLEGVVGARWGVFDTDLRAKADRSGRVREDPAWAGHAAASVALLAAGLFGFALLRRRYRLSSDSLTVAAIRRAVLLNGVAAIAAVMLWRQAVGTVGTGLVLLASLFQALLASMTAMRWSAPSPAPAIARDHGMLMKIALASMFVVMAHLACNPWHHDTATWAFATPIGVSVGNALTRRSVRDGSDGTQYLACFTVIMIATVLVNQVASGRGVVAFLIGAFCLAWPYVGAGRAFAGRTGWLTVALFVAFVVLIFAGDLWAVDPAVLAERCRSDFGVRCWQHSVSQWLSAYRVLGWGALLVAIVAAVLASRIVAIVGLFVAILAVQNWDLTLGSVAMALAALALDRVPRGRGRSRDRPVSAHAG